MRDVHVTFDAGGVWFLVGVKVFKYNRPKVTTFRSSGDQSTVTTPLSHNDVLPTMSAAWAHSRAPSAPLTSGPATFTAS